mgnify:CR=1 FL=1
MSRRPLVNRDSLPRSRALEEIAQADAAYSHTAFIDALPSKRNPEVRVTLVTRECSACGRVALDVRAPWRGDGALCSSGVGCQGRADRDAKRVAGVLR